MSITDFARNKAISAMISACIRNPAYYLQLFPEALRPVVVSVFNLDSANVVSNTEAVAESGEDTLLKAIWWGNAAYCWHTAKLY